MQHCFSIVLQMQSIALLISVVVQYTSAPVDLHTNCRTPVQVDEKQWFIDAAWGKHIPIRGPRRSRGRLQSAKMAAKIGCIVPMIACNAAILAGVYVFTNIAQSKQATTVRKRMEAGSDLWTTRVADMPCSTTRSDSHATIYGPQPIDGCLPRCG